MNISSTLRTVLIIGSVLFFIFIINMVRIKTGIKYALIWILTSVSFIIMSVFPKQCTPAGSLRLR